MTIATAKKETKEVTQIKKEVPQAVEISQIDLANIFGHTSFAPEDSPVRRLYLMYGVSQAVMEGKAQQGQIISTQPFHVFGGLGKPFEFIALKQTEQTWFLEAHDNGKWRRVKEEPITLETVKKYDEFTVWKENGLDHRASRAFNFFILPLQKIGENAPNAYFFTFRRTNVAIGKVLNEHFVKCAVALREKRSLEYLPFWRVFTMDSVLTKTASQTFHKLAVAPGRKATLDEFKQANELTKFLGNVNPPIYDLDSAEDEGTTTIPHQTGEGRSTDQY